MTGGTSRSASAGHDRWFHDKDGRLAVVQRPNLPIIVAFVAKVLARFVDGGTLDTALEAVGFGALFTWAWLELFQGDSYFRRLLGAVVLVVTVMARVR